MMVELWLEPLQDIIPGPSIRDPVNSEERHSCVTEFPSTVFDNWGLKSTANQHNANKQQQRSNCSRYGLQAQKKLDLRRWVLLLEQMMFLRKRRLVWGWEILYEHNVDR